MKDRQRNILSQVFNEKTLNEFAKLPVDAGDCAKLVETFNTEAKKQIKNINDQFDSIIAKLNAEKLAIENSDALKAKKELDHLNCKSYVLQSDIRQQVYLAQHANKESGKFRTELITYPCPCDEGYSSCYCGEMHTEERQNPIYIADPDAQRIAKIELERLKTQMNALTLAIESLSQKADFEAENKIKHLNKQIDSIKSMKKASLAQFVDLTNHDANLFMQGFGPAFDDAKKEILNCCKEARKLRDAVKPQLMLMSVKYLTKHKKMEKAHDLCATIVQNYPDTQFADEARKFDSMAIVPNLVNKKVPTFSFVFSNKNNIKNDMDTLRCHFDAMSTIKEKLDHASLTLGNNASLLKTLKDVLQTLPSEHSPVNCGQVKQLSKQALAIIDKFDDKRHSDVDALYAKYKDKLIDCTDTKSKAAFVKALSTDLAKSEWNDKGRKFFLRFVPSHIKALRAVLKSREKTTLSLDELFDQLKTILDKVTVNEQYALCQEIKAVVSEKKLLVPACNSTTIQFAL